MPAASTPRSDAIPTGWHTAAECADIAQISEGTVRAWDRRGALKKITKARKPHPSGGSREVTLYDVAEVLAVVGRRRLGQLDRGDGEVAARAFELFEQGVAPRAAVTTLRITPQVAAELHDHWLELGGCELVVTAEARAQLADLLGPFEGVADLVSLVRRRVSEDRAAVDRATDLAGVVGR